MFNSITGTITGKFPQTLYIETNGIEWDISVPDSALDLLPSVGSNGKVFTWLSHREDSMKLFGFSSATERALFLDLQKVEGVGPKAALKILSSVSASEITAVLEEGDVAKLEKLPGVGKKTAQKMLLTLKGKLTLLDDFGSPKQRQQQTVSPWEDVIKALVDMGYDRRQTEETINRLVTEMNISPSDFVTSGNRATIEENLFRKAIVELAV